MKGQRHGESPLRYVYWGELTAGALIAAVPVAIAFNLFLDRFISGITGGAVK